MEVYATTCMDLENIMQSETKQTQKDKYCRSVLTWGIKKEKGLPGCPRFGEQEWEVIAL